MRQVCYGSSLYMSYTKAMTTLGEYGTRCLYQNTNCIRIQIGEYGTRSLYQKTNQVFVSEYSVLIVRFAS